MPKLDLKEENVIINALQIMGTSNEFSSPFPPPGGERRGLGENTCFPIFFLSLLFFAAGISSSSRLSTKGSLPSPQTMGKKERGKKGIICGDLVGGEIMGGGGGGGGLPADTSFPQTGGFPNCLGILFVFLK